MALKYNTIAITGGAGFIGSHLVKHLEEQGVSRILVIDDLRYGKAEHLPQSQNVELARFSLGRDRPRDLELLLQGIDVVFHLAAEKHNQSVGSPYECFTANIDGTYALLEAAAKSGVRKVVYASSLYVYGRMHPPACDEGEVPQPRTVYGASKLCAEHLLSHFRSRFNMSGSTVRYFFVYGPSQYTGMGYRSVIVRTFEALLAGAPPIIFGDGEQVFDYVYVDDAVRATIQAMASSAEGLCLNVGSGTGVTINQLVELMQEIAGTSFPPQHLPADWTAGSSRVGRIDRAREALGWTPQVGLQEGLRRTYDWVAGQKA
jgi:UDP-glucose 4-epimerase